MWIYIYCIDMALSDNINEIKYICAENNNNKKKWNEMKYCDEEKENNKKANTKITRNVHSFCFRFINKWLPSSHTFFSI